MGEESMTPVYIGKYEDGAVRFEPLTEFEVIDHDITDVYPDDMVSPMRYIQAVMGEPITIQAFLSLKGLRGFYKAIGMPAYLRTECLFPKKKKRGTARRKRRIEREVAKAKKRFIEFIHDKYGGDLIGTRATQPIIDDFFIPDDVVPPVYTDQAIPESEFDFVVTNSTFAGPFEGEEDFNETN